MMLGRSAPLLVALGLAAHALGGSAAAEQAAPGDGAPRPSGGAAAERLLVAQAPSSAIPMPEVGNAPATRPELPPAVPPGAPSAATRPDVPARAQTRQLTYTLRQLGAVGPLSLRGTSELQGVQFGVRADEVVTAANLTLSGAMSPSLLAPFSNVTVTLNEQYVGTIPVTDGKSRFDGVEMPVSPIFFTAANRLNFRFSGRYTDQCNDPLSGLLWSTISDTSTLTLTLVRLPPQRDLARLPMPFFDTHDTQSLMLPFMTGANPTNATLQAAGMVASWFGQQADFRGASFPAARETVPGGNAVVFATSETSVPGVTLPKIDGPTLAMVVNPNDQAGTLLVVAGRNGAELTSAAQALVLGSRTLSGDHVAVTAPTIGPRVPYDAPAWIPSDRPVKFGQLVDASDLQASGYSPGTLRVPFRTAPDLYTWRNRGFPMEIRFRAPPGPILDLSASRLDVGINNLYLASIPLADDPGRTPSLLSRLVNRGDVRRLTGTGDSGAAQRLDLPAYTVFGQNELQFYFDTHPLNRGGCAAIPTDLRMAVDPDSTLDLSRAGRIASLPNLAYFVNSAFPFSRMADLSETAVIVPHDPASEEIQAYLDLMGRIGSLTGFPAVRVSVVRPDELGGVGGKDLLMIGTIGHLKGAAGLLRSGPVRLDDGRMSVAVGTPMESVSRIFGNPTDDQRRLAQGALQIAPTEAVAAMVGTENPLTAGRSLVAILAGTPETLAGLVPGLRDAEQASRVQGDLVLLTGGRATSYRVGDTYSVGHLPFWLYPSWFLQDSPFGLVALLVTGAGLLAFVFFWALRRRAAVRTRQLQA